MPDEANISGATQSGEPQKIHWLAFTGNYETKTIHAVVEERKHPLVLWKGKDGERLDCWWTPQEARDRLAHLLAHKGMPHEVVPVHGSTMRMWRRLIKQAKTEKRTRSMAKLLTEPTATTNPLIVSLGSRCFVNHVIERSSLRGLAPGGPFNLVGTFNFAFLNRSLSNNFEDWTDRTKFYSPAIQSGRPVVAVRGSDNFYFPHESYLKLKPGVKVPENLTLEKGRRSMPAYGLSPQASGATFREAYSTATRLELTDESWDLFFDKYQKRIQALRKHIAKESEQSKPNIVFVRWDTGCKPDTYWLFDSLRSLCGKTKFVLIHIVSSRNITVEEDEADIRHQEPVLTFEEGGSLCYTGKLKEVATTNEMRTNDYTCATLSILKPRMYWHLPKSNEDDE